MHEPSDTANDPLPESDEFVGLLVRHRHVLYAFIAKQLVNPADVEDVFQRTSVVLWQKVSQFDREGSFFHWACGVAWGEVRNFLRTQRRQRLHFDVDLVELLAEEARDEQTLSESRSAALNECLARLSAQQREIVRRCYVGSDTIAEVASSLGRGAGALYKQLARLREKLLTCMQARLTGEGGRS